ncbi:unnamed protein product, partial [Mesorhabditis belari]|uniref:Uncharacterized protein n=1 Tax=Mesorhabditis belari TaxID=2138241 RepID=A0AAF3EDC4_9BILA
MKKLLTRRRPYGFILFSLFSFFIGVESLCYQPWVPENGHVIFADAGPYSPGTIARYSCALGFERVGAEERTCQSNGRWSSQAPVCAIDVAKSRPTEQSSGGPSEAPIKGRCSLTDNESRSWWAVELLGEYEVHSIGIRLGVDSSEIDSVELVTTDGESQNCDIASHTFSSNQTVVVRCKASRVSRVVITAQSRLHLCTVHVYATNAVSAWQCAVSGMELVGVVDGMCFAASKEEKSDWKQAQGTCLDRGATLPMRMSPLVRKGLRSALSNANFGSSFFWIGLFAGENEWRWVDGEPLRDGEADWPEQGRAPPPNQPEAILLARPLEWKWIPSAQTAWNHYICQSKPKFCTSPGVGEAGRVAFSSHSYAIGTQCYYSCEDGFRLMGDQTRECQDGGRWSGSIPRCRRLDCGDPGQVTNGIVQFLNGTTLFEAQIEYDCSAGYELIGEKSRTCGRDGVWSGEAAICEPYDCGMPTNISHGDVSTNKTTVNGTAKYICLTEEFRLIGHDTVFCTERGVWEPAAPVCYDVATLRDMKGNIGDSNIYLVILAFLMVAILVFVVIRVFPPKTFQSHSTIETNKYTPTPVQNLQNMAQVIYAAPSALTVSQSSSSPDKVVYYATSAPIAQLEVPPQLLQLQQLPNGNIHVTLPLGRPMARPPLPGFNPHSPTPSQLLYSFDHEPFYDVPPDFDGDTLPRQPTLLKAHPTPRLPTLPRNAPPIRPKIVQSKSDDENIYERMPDLPLNSPPSDFV